MNLEQWFLLITALATSVQALLLLISIRYVNRQFGIIRACTYIERFNSEEGIKRRAAVERWIQSTGDARQRLDEFYKDIDLQVDVLGFINLFQELGVAYLHHSVNTQTIRDNFDILVPRYWNQLRFLVEHLRKTEATVYRKFQKMASDLESSRSKG